MAQLTSTLLILACVAAVLGNPTGDFKEPGLIDLADFTPANRYVKPIIPSNGTATGRIVGGFSASPGQFPWQAALFLDGRSFCGGSLISPTVILTAAHCTAGVSRVTVFLGSHDISQGTEIGRQTFESSSIHTHPQFNAKRLDYDIAVVRLPKAAVVDGTRVATVPLAKSADGTFQSTNARTSGWGKTSNNQISYTLNYADLPVISNKLCARSYGYLINGAKLCTTGGRTSTCNGDSGGPLVYRDGQGRWVQIGITSFGSPQGCASGAPAAFTRVSSYTDNFIRQFL